MKRHVLSAALCLTVVARPTWAASCDSLLTLVLPETKVLSAASVPAGPCQSPGDPAPAPVNLPAHCRVVAVSTATADSEIRFEVWLPVENWNNRFQAVGNGGWAGALAYGTGTPQAIPRNMAFALNEGYATASTDTGHVSGGRQGEFAVGHPEKLVDFARLYAGPVDPATTRVVFPGMARGSELGWDPVRGLQPFAIAESHFQHVVLNDSKWDYRTFDLRSEGVKSDAVAAELMNATDPNLQRFFSRGGKLIQFHGWNDQQISPFSSVTYYGSVVRQLGDTTVQGSYRLFMLPGMNHCGAGDGPNQFNPVSALVRWREGMSRPSR